MYYLIEVEKIMSDNMDGNSLPRQKIFHNEFYRVFLERVVKLRDEHQLDNTDLVLDFSGCDSVKNDVSFVQDTALELCGARWIFSEFTAPKELMDEINSYILVNSLYLKDKYKLGANNVHFVPGVKTQREENLDLRDIEVVNEYLSKVYKGVDEEEEDCLVLDYFDCDSAIHDKKRLQMILDGLADMALEQGIEKVQFRIGGISIVDEMIPFLVQKLYDVKYKRGIDIYLGTKDEELCDYLNQFYISRKIKKFNAKLKECKDCVGRVGMLYRYQYSKKTDLCGRQGEGKVNFTSIAILREVNESNGFVTFLEFEPKSFRTYIDSKAESDNGTYVDDRILDSYPITIKHESGDDVMLFARETIYSVVDIGLYDQFLGRRAHFDEVTQYFPKNYGMHTLDENNNLVFEEYTLPEKVMEVLLDYKIDFDELFLEKNILKTKTELLKDEVSEFWFKL